MRTPEKTMTTMMSGGFVPPGRAAFLLTALTVASSFGLAAGAAVAGEISPLSPRFQAAAEAARAESRTAAADAPTALAPSRIRVKYRETDAAEALDPSRSVDETINRSGAARVETREEREDSIETVVLDRTLAEPQLDRLVEDVAASPTVEWAVVEKIERAQQTSDPMISRQWHYLGDPAGINAPLAWENSVGADVVVAVLDTGIRPHEDIVDQLLPGYDFVDNPLRSNDGDGRDPDATDPGDWCNSDMVPISSWHGLHVAGTVAATTENAKGVAGVAPRAKILPVRVLGQCGGSSFDISDAIRWSAGAPVDGVPDNPTPAQVINLSLGGFGFCDADYLDAIREARQRGATVVVAAGNSDRDAEGFRPANCEGVITVAATNRDGARASFGRPGAGSNFGRIVDIAAPGGETFETLENGILSTLDSGFREPQGDTYEAYNGTSMAAPHVAGVVALLYQIDPTITPDEVASLLQSTSRPFPDVPLRACTTTTCGAGIVDAHAAVAAALDRRKVGCDCSKTAEKELIEAVNDGRLSLPTMVALPQEPAPSAQPMAARESTAAAMAPPSAADSLVRSITAAQVKDVEDKAFPLLVAKWPDNAVFVCWENADDTNETERGWVRDSVAQTWERHSALRFVAWTDCTEDFSGIRIKIADEGPHAKYLGKYLGYEADGVTLRVVPDGMVLNFTFNNWAPGCQSDRENCIRTIAVHEFGHAIGFAHEQNRPDTPGECRRAPQGPDGDTVLTPWDPDSVMNYCNREWMGDGVLSEFDIVGVQHIYGPPKGLADAN